MSTRNLPKKLTGTVVKKSGEKTISVSVQTLKRHKLYGKVYKVSQKYLVHDPKNIGAVGDKVIVASCRPISKLKKWYLLSKLEAVSTN